MCDDAFKELMAQSSLICEHYLQSYLKHILIVLLWRIITSKLIHKKLHRERKKSAEKKRITISFGFCMISSLLKFTLA